MKRTKYIIYFINGTWDIQYAISIHDAMILAQSEKIKNAQSIEIDYILNSDTDNTYIVSKCSFREIIK